MRVLVQHPHAPGDISGVLTSIHELLPALSARSNLEIHVLSTRTAGVREQLAALRWADAVMLNSNCLLMTLVGRLLAKPIVLKLHYPQYRTVHSDYTQMPFLRRMMSESRFLLSLDSTVRYKAESVARLALRTAVALLATRVVACSAYCAEQASLPRQVSVFRNPLRMVSIRGPRDLATLERPYRFVFAGRLSQEKGWDVLLDAAAIVAHSGRQFCVDMVGDGEDRQAVRERIASCGLGRHVELHGRRQASEVRQLLQRALAAVVPSRVQETAGYVAPEGAALGVVSLVSNVGGLPETAGPDCPAFPAGSAAGLSVLMTQCLDEPGAALDAGYRAHLRAAELFSPTAMAEQLLDLMADVSR